MTLQCASSASLSDPLLTRWPARYDQWWECKFIAEGIIDQGGGFRDSLADMSEELCPSSAECPMPLPFFTRTSNQVTHHHSFHTVKLVVIGGGCFVFLNNLVLISQGSLEAKDYYVPNPSCKDFHKYEWIGQLMGAALRGKDFMVSEDRFFTFCRWFTSLLSTNS